MPLIAGFQLKIFRRAYGGGWKTKNPLKAGYSFKVELFPVDQLNQRLRQLQEMDKKMDSVQAHLFTIWFRIIKRNWHLSSSF
jgi:hypothetical protein